MRAGRAFTLLEVILATALAAIVTVAVAQVLYVTKRAQRSIERRADARGLLGSLERRIKNDLIAVVPPGGLHASGLVGTSAESSEPLVADGTAIPAPRSGLEEPPIDERDQLVMAVLAPPAAFGQVPAPGEGALQEVTYRIDEDPATAETGLVRTALRVRDPVAGAEPPPVEPLCPQVVGMSVTYWDGEAWQETWDSGASQLLPNLVRIRLALQRPDLTLVTEELYVSPPASRVGLPPDQLVEGAATSGTEQPAGGG